MIVYDCGRYLLVLACSCVKSSCCRTPFFDRNHIGESSHPLKVAQIKLDPLGPNFGEHPFLNWSNHTILVIGLI